MKLATLSVLVSALSIVPAQIPSNDLCSNAFQLFVPHVISGSTVGAGFEAGGGACAPIGADVWFKFVAPFTGTAIVTTCSIFGGTANFDTVIVIREHFMCGVSSWVGCNDDSCFSLQSSCTAPITIGLTYDIQIGGYQGAVGNYTLSLSATPAVPTNDSCATAIPIFTNSYASAENFGATTGPDPTPNCSTVFKDVWYAFVAPSNGNYTANTCYAPNLTLSSVVSVWQGACGALTQVGCNSNGCPGVLGGSSATWCATAGTTYYVSVGGIGTSGGTFSLLINPSTNPPMELAFFNVGAGTLGFTVKNGPLGGSELTVITVNQGAYPVAWFAGISPSLQEIVDEWNTGYPFVAPLSPVCGGVVVGPFNNLPPGLTVYAVSLGFAPGATGFPSKFSNPASATIP